MGSVCIRRGLSGVAQLGFYATENDMVEGRLKRFNGVQR